VKTRDRDIDGHPTDIVAFEELHDVLVEPFWFSAERPHGRDRKSDHGGHEKHAE
jgi:hypothetical protein